MRMATYASLRVVSPKHPNGVRELRVKDLSYDNENKMFSFVQDGHLKTILREHVIGWTELNASDREGERWD